ncbi:hypothetical protein BGX26_000284 [Mortierella sp. AD094]|nr:hypothetical protein BGX26_000284 [Mortierella sp. AD094]
MTVADDRPSQEFRAKGTSAITSIDTFPDPKTGDHVILWEDIESEFENVKNIKYTQGGVSKKVSPLRGENLQDLIPKRIPYHPGVILEVVMAGTSTVVAVPNLGRPPTPSLVAPLPESGMTTVDITLQQNSDHPVKNDSVSALTTTTPNLQRSLSTFLQQRSDDSLNEQRASFFLAVMNGQETQATDIKNTIGEHFKLLIAEIEKNNVLQKENNALQQLLLQMQQKTLDQLASIHGRVQAVLKQNYELHEYPIPRLFIVLPRAKQFTDKVKMPFSNRFRLFFLCECGKHSEIPGGNDNKNKIHLAKHEGYDLEQPSKFFEK